ncbi:hypothetical protein BKA63DRAFT_519985 [Paraphoma chrysanthemicola]|jgi:hypothetical protein|nr:hypothetical protein BKA63DRAFT_519985 [Paraphoma chrysanthemicola]
MNALDALVEFTLAAPTTVLSHTDNTCGRKALPSHKAHRKCDRAPRSNEQYRKGSMAVDCDGQSDGSPRLTDQEPTPRNIHAQANESATIRDRRFREISSSQYLVFPLSHASLLHTIEPRKRSGPWLPHSRAAPFSIELLETQPWPILHGSLDSREARIRGPEMDRTGYETRCLEESCQCHATSAHASLRGNTIDLHQLGSEGDLAMDEALENEHAAPSWV